MSQSTSIWYDMKSEFLRGNNIVYQIIAVNVAIYILVGVFRLFLFLFQGDSMIYESFIKQLAVPADFKSLIFKPWTLLTYMFFHQGLFHILFNMLWLYWFGRIFREYLGNNKVLPVYILGGLAGAILYILAFNLFPVFSETLSISYALGASAGVLAVVIAAATLLPNYAIHLLFFGAVKLKYIAIVSVAIDILSIPSGNAGGHIAHLGGAIFGFVFIKQLQKGNDWSIGFNRFSDKVIAFFKSDGRQKVKATQTKQSRSAKGKKTKDKGSDYQKKIDVILDKISQSGYDSLTKEEKEFLFKASKED